MENDPNDYWLFYVNVNLAQIDIDSYMANAGDVIEFDYLPIVFNLTEEMQHKLKNVFYS